MDSPDAIQPSEPTPPGQPEAVDPATKAELAYQALVRVLDQIHNNPRTVGWQVAEQALDDFRTAIDERDATQE
jgi:hypothetical protein